MAAPLRFVEHLRQAGYHPRSNKHSNALCEAVLEDLVSRCPAMAVLASSDELVYQLNHKIQHGTSDWNVDLVIGTPSPNGDGWSGSGVMNRATPVSVRIALEAKAIMTEHRKAQRNRVRDIESFHDFVHRSDSSTVAAALLVVNVSGVFRSPLRAEPSRHKSPARLVGDAISLFRQIPLRGDAPGSQGLEASAVIVVNHDNIDLGSSTLVEGPPAPERGDPLHYDSFIQRICDRFTQRWGRK